MSDYQFDPNAPREQTDFRPNNNVDPATLDAIKNINLQQHITGDMGGTQVSADVNPYGDFWTNLARPYGLGDRAATSVWNLSNEAGMGLPNYLATKVAPEAQKTLTEMSARNPLQATTGGIAGDVASMLIPVGGEYNAASKILGGAKTLPGRLLAKAGTAAAAPASGIVSGIGRGLLQAAPQIAVRTATGNITPEQAGTGAMLAGGLGALGGVLGKVSGAVAKAAPEATGPTGKVANFIRNMSNQTIVKTLGGNKAMVKSVGGYGFQPNQVMQRAGRMKNLVSQTADLVSDAGVKNDDQMYQLIQEGIAPFKTIDQAWQNNGMKLGNYRDSIFELPAVQKYLGITSKAQKVDIPENILTEISKRNLGATPEDVQQALQSIHGGPASLAEVADSPAKATIDQLINNADKEGGLSAITNMLNDDYIKVRLSGGAGTNELKKLKDAAIQIKQLAQQAGIDSAVKSGALDPNVAQNFVKNYGPIKLLERMYESNQGNLFGSALGSDTAAKMLTANAIGGLGNPAFGGILGYEMGGPDQDMGTRLRNAAIGAAIGVGGGNLLNQAGRQIINKGLMKGATALKNTGILGRLGATGGSAIPSGGMAAIPAIQKAAQGSALGGKYLNQPGESAPQQPEAVSGATTNIPEVDPNNVTMKSLMDSNSQYLRVIGADLHRIWASGPAMQGVTLDQMAKDLAAATDGFKNVPQVAQAVFFPGDPAGAQQFTQNYNAANVLNNVDYTKLIDTLKPLWMGGQGPLKGAPWNREAIDELNQLAEMAGVDPKIAIGDIQRIAGIPQLNDQQKAQRIRDRFLSLYAQHTGRNLYNMQALGLLSPPEGRKNG